MKTVATCTKAYTIIKKKKSNTVLKEIYERKTS